MAAVVVSSLPVLSFGVAQVATTGTAGAAGSTTCSGTPGTTAEKVTYAPPGISQQGAASISAVSKAHVTSAAITCTGGHPGTGTVAKAVVKTTSTLMCQNDTNPPSPCPSGEFVYDSLGQFASGASTLFKSVPKVTWTIKGVTYVAKNTASSAAGTGTGPGNCSATEVGFVLTGNLTSPASLAGHSTEITSCLNGDTGTNTTGNTKADLTAEATNTTIVVTSSTFDPATSSILFA
jgi:hypothetical protein